MEVRVAINGFTIEKAKGKQEDDKFLPIRMVCHSMEADREDDEILPEAFNKAAPSFIGDGKGNGRGLIDYYHRSVRGKNDLEKSESILGFPTEFTWEADDSGRRLPIVYGNLVKSHPIVMNIAPHLESGSPAFQASIGGRVNKAHPGFSPVKKKAVRQIQEIEWDHMAIAPRNRVMSPGSEVTLAKAEGTLCSHPDHGISVEWTDMRGLLDDCRIAERGESSLLAKAIEAQENVTDSALRIDGGALQPQSLEGAISAAEALNDEKIKKFIQELYDAMAKDQVITNTLRGARFFLEKVRGLSQSDANEVISKFKNGLSQIAF